jgi:uncharacterized protein YebE (UPF0316 family)
MDLVLQSLLDLLRDLGRLNAQVWSGWPASWLPLAIFALRTTDQTLSTIRMLVSNQGRHLAAWLLGLMQALLFIGAISGLLGQLTNPWNLVAYAAGYGAGAAVGITIDNWLAPGHAILRIVSPGKGTGLVNALRSAGRGVTEIPGKGLEGTVSVLLCTVPRRRVAATRSALLAIDPDAFITVEPIRVLDGGWVL